MMTISPSIYAWPSEMMINKLESIWEDMVVEFLRFFSGTYMRGLRKIPRKRKVNPGPPANEDGVPIYVVHTLRNNKA